MPRKRMLIFLAVVAASIATNITLGALDFLIAREVALILELTGFLLYAKPITNWLWPPQPQPEPGGLDIATVEFIRDTWTRPSYIVRDGMLVLSPRPDYVDEATVLLIAHRLDWLITVMKSGQDPQSLTNADLWGVR